MKSVGLYVRCSTDSQAGASDYNTLHAQRDMCTNYCKAMNWDVVDVYEDVESGATLKRPGVQKMLEDIASKRIEGVVCYKIDRLTRSVKDFLTLMSDYFDKHNVAFVSVTQHIDTTTATGRLLRGILLEFAQFEREMTAERTRDKMMQRAKQGLWNGGKPPLGFIYKDKQLTVDPEGAKKVVLIFETFVQTKSFAETARRHGLSSHRAAARLLTSPLYRGRMVWGDFGPLQTASQDDSALSFVPNNLLKAVNRRLAKRSMNSDQRTEKRKRLNSPVQSPQASFLGELTSLETV